MRDQTLRFTPVEQRKNYAIIFLKRQPRIMDKNDKKESHSLTKFTPSLAEFSLCEPYNLGPQKTLITWTQNKDVPIGTQFEKQAFFRKVLICNTVYYLTMLQ